GEVLGRAIIGFRTTDSLVHGWDIARALGTEVLLDLEICDYLLDFWFPLAKSLPDSGYYGPAVMPPAGADAATRLLALLARTASCPRAPPAAPPPRPWALARPPGERWCVCACG